MKTLNKKKPSALLKVLLLPVVLVMLTLPALAGGIADSQLGKGLMALVNDVTPWLVALCPLVGGLFAVYYLIRKGMAQEQQDKDMWMKRVKDAIIGGVAGMLVSGVIALLTSYF